MLEPIAEGAAGAGKGENKICIPTVCLLSPSHSPCKQTVHDWLRSYIEQYSLPVGNLHSIAGILDVQKFIYKVAIKWYYHLSMSIQPFGELY